MVNDLSELKAEPGFSIDIGLITLLQSKLSLLTLLRGTDQIEDMDYHLLIWYNESFSGYSNLTILKVNLERRNDCAICNPAHWSESLQKLLTEAAFCMISLIHEAGHLYLLSRISSLAQLETQRDRCAGSSCLSSVLTVYRMLSPQRFRCQRTQTKIP